MKKLTTALLFLSMVLSFVCVQKAMCEEVTAGNYIYHTLNNVKDKVADMNEKTEETEKVCE